MGGLPEGSGDAGREAVGKVGTTVTAQSIKYFLKRNTKSILFSFPSCVSIVSEKGNLMSERVRIIHSVLKNNMIKRKPYVGYIKQV